MYNKVVLSAIQNVLDVRQKTLSGKTNFKSLGASPAELNWLVFETEQRLHIQLPEQVITENSTIEDLVKSIVQHQPAVLAKN